MRIIKPGKLPGEQEFTADCVHCGCRFTFLRKEAKYHSDQRDGNALVVKCPQKGCGDEIWVSVLGSCSS
jgi:hypothetical protein